MKTENRAVNFEELSSDARARIEAISKDILRLGKKDTEATFTLGALLEEASELIDDEKACDGWLISQLGITSRHGRTLRAVHRNLSPYKAKCVDCGVTPTNLYKLAHADAESVEAVLKLYEDGERPLGKDVDVIVKRKAEGDETELPVEDLPGLNGLAKYAAQEQRSRVARLKNLLQQILLHIVEAYEPKLRDRAVIKSHLREKIRLPCEEAYELLNVMIGVLRRHHHGQEAIGQLALDKPDNDGGWTRLLGLLRTLQYVEDVSSKSLPDYLINTAIPQMKWSLKLQDEDIDNLFKAAAEKNNPPASNDTKPKPHLEKANDDEPAGESGAAKGPSKAPDEAATKAAAEQFRLPDFMLRKANNAA
ncbi:hypothetical protein [uncultured Roseibium sp.]|uniref:hypothetical protein n=1 Tax=uncultured Roseibium sp. TaxID=1936171 RepID=UPI002603D429|nr:hypothetical protein [uncultured Roseibium sp.]